MRQLLQYIFSPKAMRMCACAMKTCGRLSAVVEYSKNNNAICDWWLFVFDNTVCKGSISAYTHTLHSDAADQTGGKSGKNEKNRINRSIQLTPVNDDECK